ncbi:MAG: TolC family protein, partial [Planctomycetaceae bacterium]|nr:TolC family protein [Planctomycetaceae bacterium]
GWELDIWGHYRRLVEAADAELDASVNSYDAILNTLISEVALTYVEIRSLQEQLEYARENITIQKNSLEIAEAQLREGATDQVSVEFAKANLEATTALEPGLEIELRTAANRLCVLLGVPPRQLGPILGVQPVPVVPNDVAVGIPADLIRRRPDIRADERIVAARCAQVGIAESELYPSFFINGTLKLSSQRLDRLFTSESLGGVVGPAFQWNVLNYGRLINNVKVFDAELDQAVSRYQETVLEAAAEGENGLTAFLRSQEQYTAIESSNQANLRALELVTFQFREGEIDFTPLYVLQANIVTQQIDLVRAKAEISLNLIKLYKALGGGWQLRCYVDPKCGLITQGFEGIAIPPNGPMPRLDEPFAPAGNAPLEPSVLESLQGMSEEEVRIIAAELLKQLANTQTDKTQAVEPRTNRTRDPATAPKKSIASSPTRKSVDRIGNPTDETSQKTQRSVNAFDSNPGQDQQTAFSARPENPSKTDAPRTASQVNEALKQILGRFQSEPGTDVVR